MPEILLNKETFESLSSRFNTAFSRAGEAAEFATKAETVNYVPRACLLINSKITNSAADISSVMQTIVSSFTETDQANRDKALKIREAYIGPQSKEAEFSKHSIDLLSPDQDSKFLKGSDSKKGHKDTKKNEEIEYIPLTKYDGERTEQEIIDQLAGDDRTPGSCASVAYAYAASKAGYDVTDFRGGMSQESFSSEYVLSQITHLDGVVSYKVNGYNEVKCANTLLKKTEPGKEYILFTGEHAAVVRRNGKHYEYLELQTTNENHPIPEANKGWHTLNDDLLKKRFFCETDEQWYKKLFNGVMGFDAPPSYLVEVESLSKNEDFIDAAGYFNTKESDRMVGEGGGIK